MLAHRSCNRAADAETPQQRARRQREEAADHDDAPGRHACSQVHAPGPRRLARPGERGCPHCGGALNGRCDDHAMTGTACRH
jgi:hypothetical protein